MKASIFLLFTLALININAFEVINLIGLIGYIIVHFGILVIIAKCVTPSIKH